MAITPIPYEPYPFPNPVSTLSWLDINSAAARLGAAIRCPKDGTLARVVMRLAPFSGTVTNGIRVSFQDIDTGTGFPDGTEDQFRVTASTGASTFWTSGLITSDGTDGGTKRTVSRGDLLGIVIQIENFQGGNQFQYSDFDQSNAFGLSAWARPMTYNGTSWTNQNRILNLGLEYDDGTYGEIIWTTAACVDGTINVNSGSTPDEVALRFQVPFECSTAGAYLWIDVNGPGDLILYDAADSVERSVPLLTTWVTLNAVQYRQVYWADYTLSANTTYRLAFKPSDGTNSTIRYLDTATNALMGGMPPGVEWYYSSRTDAGSWTDLTTRRPFAGLILNGIETGGGGGGGSPSAYAFA